MGGVLRSNPSVRDVVTPPHRRAFTLVELLVVIGILAVLMVMLFPTIQSAVEAGRRTRCAATQTRLAFAMATYDSRKGGLPGWRNPLTMAGKQCHVSWFVILLPFMERPDVLQAFQDGKIYRNWGFQPAPEVPVLTFSRCPSVPMRWGYNDNMHVHYRANCGAGTSNFAGDGVLADTSSGKAMRIADVQAGDGAGTTILVSECTVANLWLHSSRVEKTWPWTSPEVLVTKTAFPEAVPSGSTWWVYWDYKLSFPGEPSPFGGMTTEQKDASGLFLLLRGSPTAAMFDNGDKYMPSSNHLGGVVMAFVDGSTRFVRSTIKPHVFGHLMTSSSVWDPATSTYATNSATTNTFLKYNAPLPYVVTAEDYR